MLFSGIIERVYKAMTKQFGDYKSIQESDLKKLADLYLVQILWHKSVCNFKGFTE